jgi:hypothetical protein
VAQAQSDKFQKSGSGSHGKTLAEIGKRFEKKGYKPAAYNEAFALANAPRVSLRPARGDPRRSAVRTSRPRHC